MWFEPIPSFVRCIFRIPFPKPYLEFSSSIDNVISQVGILLVSVWIGRCSSNISQFLYAVENSIDWRVNMKIHMFDHILTLGNHLRFDFTISFEKILEDDVNGLLVGDSIAILQGSGVYCINSCYDFMK